MNERTKERKKKIKRVVRRRQGSLVAKGGRENERKGEIKERRESEEDQRSVPFDLVSSIKSIDRRYSRSSIRISFLST